MKEKKSSFLSRLGPGFITGASDDDPSGIATYAQTGAIFGYVQLWMVLWTLPFMIAVQEMCGRIGLVTGKGLSGVIRRHYSRKLLAAAVFLLLVANTINIGADLGAMASAAQLLVPVPFTVLLLLMTALTLTMEIFITYKTYAKYLKYLALSLFAYFLVAFTVTQDWMAILVHTFVPHIAFTQEYLMNVVAFLGTTISPYLFFWQANEEVEEEVACGKLRAMGVGKPRIDDCDVRAMQHDTAFGMFFSNLVTFFIITTTASTLHANGIFKIQTAADAAEALRPLAGNFAYVLFALGIIGTGLLAVPVLAGSASYAVSEAFKWREGLYLKFEKAHGFYGVITIATLLGLLVNFLPISPFAMLYYTAVVNGIIAPPLMVVILLIANNRRIMGARVNSVRANIFGITITAVMGVAGVAMIVSLLR
ncbi:MAG: divalent metal cation transporter [Candidatus Peribacteraceae bacterium]|nr:divalent metal cation transporter [Candidatus Peribacteraceae bacterium]